MRTIGLLSAALALALAGPACAQNARTLTSGEARIIAQDVANASGVSCNVGRAVVLGVDEQERRLFEVTCTGGDGGFLLHQTPSGARALDCLALSGMAEDDPTVRTCRLGGNGDARRLIRRLSAEAGVDCVVDAGRMVGTTPAGGRMIEIGCRDADGFRIEQTPDRGWIAVPCLVLARQDFRCRYTSASDQAATARRWLSTGSARACDVTSVRYRGFSARGSAFEVGCGAAQGYFVRLNERGDVSEILTCEEAAHIAGGCQLDRPRDRPVSPR